MNNYKYVIFSKYEEDIDAIIYSNIEKDKIENDIREICDKWHNDEIDTSQLEYITEQLEAKYNTDVQIQSVYSNNNIDIIYY